MNSKLKDRLIEAQALIEKGWCQGAAARTVFGIEVKSTSFLATQYCPLGAISRVYKGGGIAAVIAFGKANNIANIAYWNDYPVRTKEDVIKAFERAIAWIEVGEGQLRELELV